MKQAFTAPTADEGRRLPLLKEGDSFAGRYRVESQMGEGLFGRLYLVKHLKYGQKMILKVFYPGVSTGAHQKTFKAEFDQLKQIKDPRLARYFDMGEWAEAASTYCTLEYLAGSSLRSLMNELEKQDRRVSPQDAVQIAIKLVEALKVIHATGLTHRNIKPENILIVARGKAAEKVEWDVRLSDFALTKAPVDWLTEVSHTKRPYMAPELLGYGGQVGPKSDIFAVGALLYEMLTGTPPDQEVVPPTQRNAVLPKKFDDIIELCLAASATDRYQSAQDLLYELKDLPTVISSETVPPQRSLLTILAVLTGLAVLAGVILFLVTRTPETPVKASGPEYWTQLRQKVKSSADFVTDTPEQVAEKQKAAPAGMVYVPGGSFIKGAMKGEPHAAANEPGEKQVKMPGFYIDQYEFPNKAGELPLTSLTWEEAERECNKFGKRLCTAEEWERSCKGDGSLIYGYSDTYDPSICPPIGNDGVKPLGSNPQCSSSYGVFDMAGGVMEWTNASLANRTERRLTKGGVIGQEVRGSRCASIQDEITNYANKNLGFRCCKK